jgi:hypothetical protein
MESITRQTTLDQIKGTAITLASEGKTYREIATLLGKNGFRTAGNKRPTIGYISNLLYRARKNGYASISTSKGYTSNARTSTARIPRTAKEFLETVNVPTGIQNLTGVELAKRELTKAVIGTSVFTPEFKTNVVAAIFQN